MTLLKKAGIYQARRSIVRDQSNPFPSLLKSTCRHADSSAWFFLRRETPANQLQSCPRARVTPLDFLPGWVFYSLGTDKW